MRRARAVRARAGEGESGAFKREKEKKREREGFFNMRNVMRGFAEIWRGMRGVLEYLEWINMRHGHNVNGALKVLSMLVYLV